MYKKEESRDDINFGKKIKCMDSIDIRYYNNLSEICKLFNKEKYRTIIGSKIRADSTNQTIIFINLINETEKYTLNIHNKFSMTIKIPLKKTNYIYITSFMELGEVYNYLKIHV
tara:strand:- start:630 stop:971 length:342 start_codon:yes stop_codon:yes gene_type:complete